MTKTANQRRYRLHELIKDDFPLYVMKCRGGNHVLHDHDFTELVIVEQGKGIHHAGTFRHRIMTGDVLVIPESTKHGYEDTDKLKIINVIFDMALLNSLPEDFRHIPGFYSLFLLNQRQRNTAAGKKGFLSLDPDEITKVEQLVSKMEKELEERRGGYRSICVTALTELVVFLSRKASRHNLASHSGRLAEALCFMQKNFARNITIEQLSRIVNLSPRSFQRIFRDYMGTSPFDYLINLRVRYAKKLLEDTDLNIGEIAAVTGFNDNAYFTRQFKAIFRIPPTLYRKQLGAGDVERE